MNENEEKQKKILEVRNEITKGLQMKLDTTNEPLHTDIFYDGVHVKSVGSILRCPNYKEESEWLINALRSVKWRYELTHDQYYSLKGQCKKNHQNALNFLIRFNSEIGVNFLKFKSTKNIVDMSLIAEFSEPVKSEIIEIPLEDDK